MPVTDKPIEDYLEIAEKVRTGEYFQEARQMYDIEVHDVMSERYFYLVITLLSALVLLVAFVAARALYPLQTSVPFIYNTSDAVEDLPRVRSLLEYKGQDPGEALLNFMVRNYVRSYEEYDVETFDRNVNAIQSQSAPDVFAIFQSLITPGNPESPIATYQRHSRRTVAVVSSKRLREESGYDMEVMFEATVENKDNKSIKKSRWLADIAFQYSGLELDEKGETIKPVSFTVTKYETKRLQDTK